MTATVLTPELARTLLEKSGQSAVSHARLLYLLDNWTELAGSTIWLSGDGLLSDGHHRCTLVVLTGRTIIVDLEYENFEVEW